ncbi:MAG: zinc ribbon domain-containing protein [Phycisphaerales bacterium JB058]
MPTYDYRCPANGRTVEVRHSMRESVSSWGDLCRLAGIDPGATPPRSPVERVVNVPAVLAKPGGPASGGCCGVPGCGPNH